MVTPNMRPSLRAVLMSGVRIDKEEVRLLYSLTVFRSDIPKLGCLGLDGRRTGVAMEIV